MTDNPTAFGVETASVTDRGLNERRPLNEDSMLSDPGRGIFVVADGVGGAEAGEVASQTAVEVLSEAFRHHKEGEDAEDLMEIAIQRANDAIYRLSREEPRFSMMATTIVALHLDGLRATVGHVGDSRLYRLTPGGGLRRETEDHSLVEEEVRAGRMTEQQAANHPSRNVISRALGAEAAVEVDLRTFDFEGDTTFLLCSDGITRHIPDAELAALLAAAPGLEDACAEMKRLCYERGAEDNLTAVLVRVGGPDARAAGDPARRDADEAPTLVGERPGLAAAPADATLLRRPFNDAGPATASTSPNATDTNGPARTSAGDDHTSNARPEVRQSGGAGRVVGVLALLAVVGAAAFYAGLLYGRRSPEATAGRDPRAGSTSATPAAAPTPAALGGVGVDATAFEQRRKAVDLAPAAQASRMAAEAGGQPLNSADPEFLYLYGRAMLLSDRQEEAVAAFNRAVERINENMTPANGQLKIDARLATIAAHLRAGHPDEARGVAVTLDELIRKDAPPGAENAPPSPGTTP